MHIVGFLQNAWSPMYAGEEWPRESWLLALARSRSGQRLRILENELVPPHTIWYDNTTPIVGATSNSVVPPDARHIQCVLSNQYPDIVIAFGKQAAKALRSLCTCPLLILPHPAYRVLTNRLYEDAARHLKRNFPRLENVIVEMSETKDEIHYQWSYRENNL
jgi:hypothetical protein